MTDDELLADLAERHELRQKAAVRWTTLAVLQTLDIAAEECPVEFRKVLKKVFDLAGTIDEHNRIGALLMETIQRQSDLEAQLRKMANWIGKARSWASEISAKAKQIEALESRLTAIEKRVKLLNATVPYVVNKHANHK